MLMVTQSVAPSVLCLRNTDICSLSEKHAYFKRVETLTVLNCHTVMQMDPTRVSGSLG
jgi:hypothetical protein